MLQLIQQFADYRQSEPQTQLGQHETPLLYNI